MYHIYLNYAFAYNKVLHVFVIARMKFATMKHEYFQTGFITYRFMTLRTIMIK